MRRVNAVSVKVKAPSRGLVTRWPGETADQLATGVDKFSLPGMANRASTFASNVRYEDGVVKNAPGFVRVAGADSLIAHWPLDEASGVRFDTTVNHLDLGEQNPPVEQTTGQINFAAHFTGSGVPPFNCPSVCNFFTIPGTPEDVIVSTRTSSVRRLAVMSATDSLVTFIDSGASSVITQTACTNQASEFGLASRAAFAISSGEFYIPTFDGAKVFTADGVFVTTVAMPGDLSGGSLADLIYSPDTDLIYGYAFSSGTSSRHVFTIDPATHVATDVFDTGDASFARIGLTNNQFILAVPNFQLRAYALSDFTLNNSLNVPTHGMVEYAPSIDRIFVGENVFGGLTQIDQIDPATLTVEKTYTAAVDTGIASYLCYNPVTNTMDMTANGLLIIDLEGQNLVCEQAFEDGVTGVGVDFFNGGAFSIEADGNTDPNMFLFSLCS